MKRKQLEVDRTSKKEKDETIQSMVEAQLLGVLMLFKQRKAFIKLS